MIYGEELHREAAVRRIMIQIRRDDVADDSPRSVADSDDEFDGGCDDDDDVSTVGSPPSNDALDVDDYDRDTLGCLELPLQPHSVSSATSTVSTPATQLVSSGSFHLSSLPRWARTVFSDEDTEDFERRAVARSQIQAVQGLTVQTTRDATPVQGASTGNHAANSGGADGSSSD